MKLRDVWVVFRKEVLDNLRDRRYMFYTLALPPLTVLLVLFTATMEIAPRAIDTVASDVRIAIAVEGAAEGPSLVTFLKQEAFEVIAVESAEDALSSRLAQFSLTIPPRFEDIIREQGASSLSVRYNNDEQGSDALRQHLVSTLDRYAEDIVVARLRERGVDPTLLKPVKIQIYPVGVAGTMSHLAGIIPLFLVMWGASNIHVAVDQTVGEKEHGTLELLLTAPISRLSLVVGKYLTVVLASVLSQWLCLAAFLLGLAAQLQLADESTTAALILPLPNLLGVLAGAILLAAFLAAVQISLSLPAKSVREAQALQAAFALAPILLWMLIQNFPHGRVPFYMFFVPVINNLLLNRELLMGMFTPVNMLVTFLMCALAAALALRWATHRFNQESVLFRQ